MKKKKPKVLIEKPTFQEFDKIMTLSLSAFLGLSHQMAFTGRAFTNYKKDMPENYIFPNPLQPLSMIMKGFVCDYAEGLNGFFNEMTEMENLIQQYFILNFVKAEHLLSKIVPVDDLFALNCEFLEPEDWFSNLNFKEYVNFNTECLYEVKRSRNDLLHNGGIVTCRYVNERAQFFSGIENFLNSSDPYKDIFYKPIIEQRLKLCEGEKLPFEYNYIGFVQTTLIERVFLKSGAYHYLYSPNEREDLLIENRPFKLLPFHKWDVP